MKLFIRFLKENNIYNPHIVKLFVKKFKKCEILPHLIMCDFLSYDNLENQLNEIYEKKFNKIIKNIFIDDICLVLKDELKLININQYYSVNNIQTLFSESIDKFELSKILSNIKSNSNQNTNLYNILIINFYKK